MAFLSSSRRARFRRRKTFVLRAGLWVLGICLFFILGYSSYRTGLELADLKVSQLEGELARIRHERDVAQTSRDGIQAALTQANQQIAELRSRYDAIVPKGDLASLLQLLRDRMGDGVPVDRLNQALRDARAVSVCEGPPVSKRIAIRSATRSNSIDSISFADGLITVFVTHDTDAEGQPITVHFSRFPGQETVATGPSPLRHGVVIGNIEFRFTVTLSDLRGFVVIAMNSCGR